MSQNSTVIDTKKFNKILKKTINEISKVVAQDTIIKMKSFLYQYWYKKYSISNYYERTFSLPDSLKYEIDNGQIFIYADYDDKDFIYDFRETGFGSHTNFSGEKLKDEFIDYMENGFTVGFVNWTQPSIKFEGSHFIERTQNWLNAYLPKEVQQKLNTEFIY